MNRNINVATSHPYEHEQEHHCCHVEECREGPEERGHHELEAPGLGDKLDDPQYSQHSEQGHDGQVGGGGVVHDDTLYNKVKDRVT